MSPSLMLPTLMHALVPILFPALVPASGADIGAGLGHRYLSADLGAGKWCRHRCRTWASVPQCRQNPTKVYKPACLAVGDSISQRQTGKSQNRDRVEDRRTVRER
jgi:hypothetical protein